VFHIEVKINRSLKFGQSGRSMSPRFCGYRFEEERWAGDPPAGQA
jgi:hypothetical protein